MTPGRSLSLSRFVGDLPFIEIYAALLGNLSVALLLLLVWSGVPRQAERAVQSPVAPLGREECSRRAEKISPTRKSEPTVGCRPARARTGASRPRDSAVDSRLRRYRQSK
jgi:hypothetical protein